MVLKLRLNKGVTTWWFGNGFCTFLQKNEDEGENGDNNGQG